MFRSCVLLLTTLLWLSHYELAFSQSVTIDRNTDDAGPGFRFKKVQRPRRADLGSTGTFRIVDGDRDPNGASVTALHDGVLPAEEDQPSSNFFFRAGTKGGRLALDLGKVHELVGINTYSWHAGGRAPQVYTVYGASGTNEGFVLNPKRPSDPVQCGWVLIARVDSREEGEDQGGQHAVGITGKSGSIGSFQHILFDVETTSPGDPFGQTFISEIDVIDSNSQPEEPEPAPVDVAKHRTTVALDGGYEILLDTSETPDLTDWSNETLVPMIKDWYPKIVAALPSSDYQAPKRVSIFIRKDMRGVAATSGTRVNCAANWMRRELKGEAVGAVFHELVHVVQQYGRVRRPGAGPVNRPGWLVEGIADYMRWFQFEPTSKGAEISPASASRVNYDNSYRISANFLNWVVINKDKEIIRKLNAALREGAYTPEMWQEYTGHPLETLGQLWKSALQTPASVQ